MRPIYPIYNPKQIDKTERIKRIKSPKQDFSSVLQREMERSGSPAKIVEFSKHAVKRTQQRGISFDEQDLSKISEAIEKMNRKGSKEALLLYRNIGLLVNVVEKRVITCVDRQRLKEDVFTNIDGVMILE